MTKEPPPTGSKAHCHSDELLIEHQTRREVGSVSCRATREGMAIWLAQSLLVDFLSSELNRRDLFSGFMGQILQEQVEYSALLFVPLRTRETSKLCKALLFSILLLQDAEVRLSSPFPIVHAEGFGMNH